MPFDPQTGVYKPEDTSVATRVTGLINKDSPLMQQAATKGLKSANRRGLLNSSMGVQAAQAASLEAAVPIASQEAGQAHQSNLQAREIQSQFGMQGADLASRERMQQFDIQFREQLASLDREAQERIATMNVAAGERQAAAQMAVQFESSYAQMVSTIMNNPDIPAAVRQQYLAHAARIRDSNLALVEQMYGIELDWSTPGTLGGGTSGVGGLPPNDGGFFGGINTTGGQEGTGAGSGTPPPPVVGSSGGYGAGSGGGFEDLPLEDIQSPVVPTKPDEDPDEKVRRRGGGR